jgi:hypothetical protein
MRDCSNEASYIFTVHTDGGILSSSESLLFTNGSRNESDINIVKLDKIFSIHFSVLSKRVGKNKYFDPTTDAKRFEKIRTKFK